MVTVALAGASSGLGLTVLNEIIATKKHRVIVLTRGLQPSLADKGVEVRPVDYTDHAILTHALRDVDTVISTIGAFDAEVMKNTQIALLNAAKEAGVRRFAPSEFAHSTYNGIDLYQPKLDVWNAVKASGLEYTRFATGIFTNMFGTGTPKGEEEALAGLRPWNFVINMRAGTADLPGKGDDKITLTEMKDVGKFVAASLDLDEWEEESGMSGDLITFNEMISLAEQETGRKFLVKYNSMAEMQEMADKEPHRRFYHQVRMAIARGEFVVKPTLDQRLPDMRPVTVKEFLDNWWDGVTLGEPAWEEDYIAA